LASRALTLREGAAPVRDRLLTTLFLAGVLHGMVILGVTFSAAVGGSDGAPGLQVLLVSDEIPEAERNDSATYLAQRTQIGSGNTTEAVTPRNNSSAPSIKGQDGAVDGTSLGSQGSSSDGGGDERVLATSATRVEIRYFTTSGEDAESTDKPLLIAEQQSEQQGAETEPGTAQLRGPKREELWITPDTREASLAPYLDAWRRKVERIGTLNYPVAAKRVGVKASPVLEVAIDSSGTLTKASIRQTSGYPDLDQAALEILKLASPFDSFPAELAQEYSVLRFAYEWQFVGGRSTGSVYAAP
jgi:periplasmic protein TonB